MIKKGIIRSYETGGRDVGTWDGGWETLYEYHLKIVEFLRLVRGRTG